MMSKTFLLGLISLSAVSAQVLEVEVYYESLCSDSIQFVTFEVTDVHRNLTSDVFFKFVPYGFAKTQESGGSYTFKCQHGPMECVGNIIQGCIIKHIPDNDIQIKLITCMMSLSFEDQSVAAQECFDMHHIDMTDVKACSNGEEGKQIHADNGKITGGLSPRPDNVPWLTFNGTFELEFWEYESTSLLSYICNSKYRTPHCS